MTSLTSYAQLVVQVGTGTTSNAANNQPVPYGAWYSQSKMQMLITKTELNALGINGQTTFGSLAFNVTGGTFGAHQNFSIKMKNTASTALSAY